MLTFDYSCRCHDGLQLLQTILVQMLHQNFQSRSRWTVHNLKWMIIVLLNYGSRNMEVLDISRQFIGCGRLGDRVLLTSVRTWDHYPWLWIGRIKEHTEAAVYNAMCIPEQHRELTTRAITRVEWHIGNTHSSEVNAGNPFFGRSGGQVYRFLFVCLFILGGNDYRMVFSLEHQFNLT